MQFRLSITIYNTLESEEMSKNKLIEEEIKYI